MCEGVSKMPYQEYPPKREEKDKFDWRKQPHESHMAAWLSFILNWILLIFIVAIIAFALVAIVQMVMGWFGG